MLKPTEPLCCDDSLSNLSEASRLQKDMSRLVRLFYLFSRGHVSTLHITLLQGYTLMGLQLNGRMTMTEISTYSKLSTSTMTRVVDKLVKAELVERVHGENDRRIVYLKLTPAGERKTTAFRISQSLLFQRLLAGLVSADREKVLSGLAILTDQLERFPKETEIVLENLEATSLIEEDL